MMPGRQGDHERLTLGVLLEEPLLRSATVFAADGALERPVSWCLPWPVASRGAEALQHMLVHVNEDLSTALVDALCREIPVLCARGVAALAVNAAAPGEPLRTAALTAGLPLLGLPENTAHLALSRLVAEKNLANAAHVLQYGVTVHHASARCSTAARGWPRWPTRCAALAGARCSCWTRTWSSSQPTWSASSRRGRRRLPRASGQRSHPVRW